MGIADDAVEVRAQGWRTLAAVHGLIEGRLEKALQAGHELSVVEFTVLDALSRQDGWHMRMQQLARAAALSSSATTRLVTRLENRGLLTRVLCADDRRGIYTELTDAGRALVADARPTHDAALQDAQTEATLAVDAYRRLVALQPNDPNVQLELAQAAQQVGDATTAIAAYQKFLELAPDDPSAAVVRQQLKQLRGAAAASSG